MACTYGGIAWEENRVVSSVIGVFGDRIGIYTKTSICI